jgi:hypothetical protein
LHLLRGLSIAFVEGFVQGFGQGFVQGFIHCIC